MEMVEIINPWLQVELDPEKKYSEVQMKEVYAEVFTIKLRREKNDRSEVRDY